MGFWWGVLDQWKLLTGTYNKRLLFYTLGQLPASASQLTYHLIFLPVCVYDQPARLLDYPCSCPHINPTLCSQHHCLPGCKLFCPFAHPISCPSIFGDLRTCLPAHSPFSLSDWQPVCRSACSTARLHICRLAHTPDLPSRSLSHQPSYLDLPVRFPLALLHAGSQTWSPTCC